MIFNKGVLCEFLELARSNVKNRHALVLFVEPEEKEEGFDYYNTYFWNILKYLNEHGPKEWPSNWSTAPDNPNWEFVFDKEPIFISANAPFYKQRITRNVGKCLILIFQPRRIFADISHEIKQGKKSY
ncbi:YqcI/YcgG family protein [Bacillus rhizoplanae]|uniref:YqcI/YcgG family protein n=1 Tax=Bacillus rhizoplanae TaxID=2880966 RepID=UPI003D1C8979